MIVCPVCEHAQPQGAECDVCGKRLAHGEAGAPPLPQVEGLEPTLHATVDAPVERVADVEPTIRPAAAALPDPTPDVESGRAAPVDVAPDAVPDLERADDGIPTDAPTAVPAFITCRYCRTPAMPGERLCGRCGMRLPEFGGARAREVELPPSHCTCGATVRAGGRCPTCGVRVG